MVIRQYQTTVDNHARSVLIRNEIGIGRFGGERLWQRNLRNGTQWKIRANANLIASYTGNRNHRWFSACYRLNQNLFKRQGDLVAVDLLSVNRSGRRK